MVMLIGKWTILVLVGLALAGAGCGAAEAISGTASCDDWIVASSNQQTAYASDAISHLKGIRGGIYTTDPTRFADDISKVCSSPSFEKSTVEQVAAQLVEAAGPRE